MDKLGDLTWQIIRCRVVNAYPLEYKSEILLQMTVFRCASSSHARIYPLRRNPPERLLD